MIEVLLHGGPADGKRFDMDLRQPDPTLSFPHREGAAEYWHGTAPVEDQVAYGLAHYRLAMVNEWPFGRQPVFIDGAFIYDYVRPAGEA